MAKNKLRRLSAEGKKEFGHIFKDGYVPVVDMTPHTAQLGSEGMDIVFLVDWQRLTRFQQDSIVAYLVIQFNASEAEVRTEIESNGHFPIRKCYIIESYDLRYFI